MIMCCLSLRTRIQSRMQAFNFQIQEARLHVGVSLPRV